MTRSTTCHPQNKQDFIPNWTWVPGFSFYDDKLRNRWSPRWCAIDVKFWPSDCMLRLPGWRIGKKGTQSTRIYITIPKSCWPWAKQSGPLLPLPQKRSNIPVGCLCLSPHLAAETVIEMAGKSLNTHTPSSSWWQMNVCVLCEATRTKLCTRDALTEAAVGFSSLHKYNQIPKFVSRLFAARQQNWLLHWHIFPQNKWVWGSVYFQNCTACFWHVNIQFCVHI